MGGLKWLFARKESQHAFSSVAQGLQQLYSTKMLPLEEDSGFHHFHSPRLPAAYFTSKPVVLTMGQYSTGKTTFIQHLLGRDYPGLHIGPEPTTDRFVIVCEGDREQTVGGNAAIYDEALPFSGLSAFGNAFLDRLECAKLPSPLLSGVTLVDTPGVLSGEKQRIQRGYDFEEVLARLAEQSDMIILFFDAHKLDVSDEFKRCIDLSLDGNLPKARIVLNKADQITPRELLRVLGALMWSLSKVMRTPEVARVYVSSFWDQPLAGDRDLFEKERGDLYSQIEQLPATSTVRRINDISRRARLVRAHALLLEHLRAAMPLVWQRANTQKELLDSLPSIYQEVSRKHGVPLGDFPSVELMRSKLEGVDLSQLRRLHRGKLQELESLLSEDVPALLGLAFLDPSCRGASDEAAAAVEALVAKPGYGGFMSSA